MPENEEIDYSMDKLIKNNGSTYYIDVSDFNVENKTKLPFLSTLMVGDPNTHSTVGYYYADDKGNWIKY